jgi:adenylate cyclase
MIADVAGYARLMECDEQGTHLRLRKLEAEVIATHVLRNHGQVVQTAGDAFLAVFDTPKDALQCAIAIQTSVAERNAVDDLRDSIELRIGVNVGEILVDDEGVAGVAVNIAARLQTLAQPGGICVSAAVRDAVGSDPPLGFIDAGRRRVKNMRRPVHVYRLRGVTRRADDRLPSRVLSALARLHAFFLVAARMPATYWNVSGRSS